MVREYHQLNFSTARDFPCYDTQTLQHGKRQNDEVVVASDAAAGSASQGAIDPTEASVRD